MDYTTLTIRQLKAEASGKVPGYSRLNKADLIAALQAWEASQVQPSVEVIEDVNKDATEQEVAPTPTPVDHPTWADLIHTVYLVVCAFIATAVWAGVKVGQSWRRSSGVRVQFYRWAEWEVAGMLGWRLV